MQRRLLPIVVIAICVSMAGAFFWHPWQARAATSVTIDTTTTLTANGNFQGFGVQDDANMLWTTPNYTNGSRVPNDYNAYIKPRLQAMKPGFVRKFIDLGWFAYTQGTYDWTSTDMQGLYTDLQTLKDANVPVMLTIWRIPSWLTSIANNKDTENRTAGAFPTAGASPNYDDLWSTVVTDLIKHLYGTDSSGYSFTNIKYLNGPNELETERSVSRLNNPTSLLNTKLAAANLGSSVTLVGPDDYDVNNVATAVGDSTLSPLLGWYDYHDYESSADGTFVSDIGTGKSAVSNSGKQIWETEFGDISNGNNSWTNLPTFAINGANHGLAALSVWDLLDQVYDTGVVLDNGKWGLIGAQSTGYTPKTSYYVWSDITAHTAAGSKVYANSCDTENCTNLRISAFDDQHGHQTVLVYNLDTSNAQSVSIAYSGTAPSNQTLYRYLVNPTSLPTASSAGNLQSYDSSVPLTNGAFTDTIPAGSFAIYSSLNPVGASTASSNLAAGKTVTTSSTVSWTSSYGGSNLTDGSNTDFWTSQLLSSNSANEYAYVDLGSQQTFSRVELFPRVVSGVVKAFPSSFTIQGANDPNGTWTTLDTETNFPTPSADAAASIWVGSQSYRYVRVHVTTATTDGANYYVQLAEMEVYNTPLSSNKAVTTSSTVSWTSSYGGSNLTDGSNTDFWTSQMLSSSSANEYAYVDLGSQQSFSRVELFPRTVSGAVKAFPSAFTIQGSNDPNGAWTTLDTETSFPTPAATAASSFWVGAQSYRYVRVHVTTATTDGANYYVQLAEIEVY